MPTVEDHRDIAMIELRRYAQPDSTPALDADDLGAILDASQRATFWITATAYLPGDVVMPTVKNGHRYICVETIDGGESGATEPIWPKTTSSKILDGEVTWREAGPDYENVFDVRAAAHEAWTVKEAKASELFDLPGQQISQIAENCRRMAESFDPLGIA